MARPRLDAQPEWHSSVLTRSTTLKREFDLGRKATEAAELLANALMEMQKANAKLPGGGEELARALDEMAAQVRAMNEREAA